MAKTTQIKLLLLLLTVLIAKASIVEASKQFLGGERRLSSLDNSGRELMHMHMQTTPLYGNQTGLEYYYATVYFGTQKQP